MLLRDSREHPQVARAARSPPSWRPSAASASASLLPPTAATLERLASLVQLIDYATVYLAIALGIDPGPIAAIQELKARIA